MQFRLTKYKAFYYKIYAIFFINLKREKKIENFQKRSTKISRATSNFIINMRIKLKWTKMAKWNFIKQQQPSNATTKRKKNFPFVLCTWMRKYGMSNNPFIIIHRLVLFLLLFSTLKIFFSIYDCDYVSVCMYMHGNLGEDIEQERESTVWVNIKRWHFSFSST